MDRIGGEVVKTLGRGAFGVASLVKMESGEHKVVKQVDVSAMSLPDREHAYKEVGVLQQLKHDHIVAIFEAFLAEAKLFILMEFADAGDLAGEVNRRKDQQPVEPFPESTALKYFGQCLLALKFTHSKKIVHRDIKCQNIFLTQGGDVKLGDFGVAKVQETTAAVAGTMIGTPSYMAPEVCEDHPYGSKVDIWSMGVVLFELVALSLPFVANNIAALIMKIVDKDPEQLPEGASDELREVVGKALTKKAEDRPTASDLLKEPAVKRNLSQSSKEIGGSTIAEFEKVRDLGKGAFGVAVLYRHLRGTGTPHRVIKTIDMTRMAPDQKKASEKEVEVLRRLAHPHIIAYFDCFRENDTLHIVLEYADGGDLASDIKARTDPYEEKEALSMFGQCLLALRYIHRRKICHRDIKSQNIFLMKTRDVKLGDFGIAKVMQDTLQEPTELVGTPSFLAPEMCKNEKYDGKVDIWAMGVVLYELATLSQPFLCNNIAATILKIVSGQPEPVPSSVSQDVRGILDKALQKKPEDRPSAAALLEMPAVSDCLDAGDLKETNTASQFGGSEDSDADDWSFADPQPMGQTANSIEILEANLDSGIPDTTLDSSALSGDPDRAPGTDLSTTVGSAALENTADPAEIASSSAKQPEPAEKEKEESPAEALSRLAEQAETGGQEEMSALIKHIKKMQNDTGVAPVVFAASVVEGWTDWTEVKTTLKNLSYEKRSPEAVVCKALINALDKKIFEQEEREFMMTLRREETQKKEKAEKKEKKKAEAVAAKGSSSSAAAAEATPQHSARSSGSGGNLRLLRRTSAPEAADDGGPGAAGSGSAAPSRPASAAKSKSKGSVAEGAGGGGAAVEAEAEAEGGGDNDLILQLLTTADESGEEGDMKAFVIEMGRQAQEFGDRPKDVADALGGLWSGDLSGKVKTLKGITFDGPSQINDNLCRKVLISAIQDRMMAEETEEYNKALAREKADALASTAGKKAAGAALAAVRQKRGKK